MHQSRGFRPDIEGLRGIAVLLVVLYHAAIPGFSGGYVGVDVFFTLSGYLITGILVAEIARTGTLKLANFYARRARRLLPAVAVVLLAVGAFAYTFYAPMEQRVFVNTAVATAAYASNIYFGTNATDYLAADAETNPLLHTWSLSVEEQFYVFWPLIVLLALRGLRRRDPESTTPLHHRRLIWVMGGVAFFSFALTLALMRSYQHWAFFSSPTRGWEFAVGALGALVPLSFAEQRVRYAVGWAGLACVLAAGIFYTPTTPFPGWAALLPTLGTVMVLRAGLTEQPQRWLARVLDSAPLQQAGRLSYSWYLWHWPVLVFADGMMGKGMTMGLRVALLALSLALAEASYRLVENPIRHNPLVGRRPAYGLALGACLTLCCVVGSFGWGKMAGRAARSPEQQVFKTASTDRTKGCIAPMRSTSVKPCVLGDTSAVKTAVLFGNSHAHQWVAALDTMLEERNVKLLTVAHSGCTFSREPVWNGTLKRLHWECVEWDKKAQAYLQELKPDLIFVANSTSNALDEIDLSRGVFDEVSIMAPITRRIIHIVDTPRHDFDVPTCLARAVWRGKSQNHCTSPLESIDRQRGLVQMKAIEKVPGTLVIDMADQFCENGTCRSVTSDGVIMYRDSHHITDTFARKLAPVLGQRLDSLLQQAPAAAPEVRVATMPR